MPSPVAPSPLAFNTSLPLYETLSVIASAESSWKSGQHVVPLQVTAALASTFPSTRLAALNHGQLEALPAVSVRLAALVGARPPTLSTLSASTWSVLYFTWAVTLPLGAAG